MTVYIEYVFIDNLIIDYLLFKATFTLTGNGYNKGRLLFCAFLGGVFALLYPLISAHTVIVTVIKVLFGLLIMLLANSYRTKKNFYVNTVVFFGLTFLVGGAIIGVFSLLGLEYSAEFSIACDCAVSVFINKADEQKKLLDILKKSAEHKFYIGDTEIENSGEIAKEKVQLFLERIMNYKTKAENNC